MDVAFPGESSNYREARNELLQAEIELRRATEAVAQQRRKLPPGGVVQQDYTFTERNHGAETAATLSDLFGQHDMLVAYNFMYGPDMEAPCPSCTSILDSLDGATQHVTQRLALVAVAKSPIERILEFAQQRGWRNLRLVSSAGTTYNRDYLGELDDGSQYPMLNVFRRDGEQICHFWGSELLYSPGDPGEESRHVDMIWPIWNILDLSPDGRGTDWNPALSYN